MKQVDEAQARIETPEEISGSLGKITFNIQQIKYFVVGWI